MAGHFTKNQKIPYFVEDDLFSDTDAATAITEFDTILRPLMQWNDVSAATGPNGVLKNTNSCFLTDVYKSYEASPIFKITRKYYSSSFVKKLTDHHWLFDCINLYQGDLGEHMQFIYYASSDNYGAHHDSFLFTFLWWLAPEPISGGDLILDDTDTVEFKHNRVVVFPVTMKHEVTPVTASGTGRYCVSNFVNLQPA